MGQASPFKLFDVRGSFPDQLNQGFAYRLGLAVARTFPQETGFVVGNDNRKSSGILKNGLVEALNLSGKDAVDIGMATTPLVYFTAQALKLKGIAITASHIGKESNGFKFVHQNGLPFNQKEIAKLKESFLKLNAPKGRKGKGQVFKKSLQTDYVDTVAQKTGSLKNSPRAVFDSGNGSAGPIAELLLEKLEANFVPLFFKSDGSYPNREPNPLIEENRRALVAEVKAQRTELGFAWDSDADRLVVVDKTGELIKPTYLNGLIGAILVRGRGGRVVLDIRAGMAAQHLIEEAGGQVIRTAAWHPTIKFAMASDEAIVFGGETSGHLIFRDFFPIDDGIFAALYLLKIWPKESRFIESSLETLKKNYFEIEEKNYKMSQEPTGLIEAVAKKFAGEGQVNLIDGVTVTFTDWRFNLRQSQTEPVLRLNLEAKSEEMAAQKVAMITEKIERFKKGGKR